MTSTSSNAILEQLAVLIPYRTEAGSWNQGLADVVSADWASEFPEVQVIWGTDGGEPGSILNYSWAMKVARSMTKRKLILNAEFDQLPPDRWSLISAIRALLRQDLPWVRPYRNRQLATEESTHQYLEDQSASLVSAGQIGAMATNIVRAEIWDELGGYDPRFTGHGGFENGAFRRALRTLYPNGRRLGNDGPFILWRPDTVKMAMTNEHLQDAALLDRYLQCNGRSPRDMRRMRELVSEAKSWPGTGNTQATAHIINAESGQTVEPSITGTPETQLAVADPDPASAETAEGLSLNAIIDSGDQPTPIKREKAPAAVEGYHWDPEELADQGESAPPDPVAERDSSPEGEQQEGTRD